MRSTIGIRIDAPADRVLALAGEVERWPELLPHYRRVAIGGRRGARVLARMVAVRQFGPIPVPVSWRAICWAESDDPSDLRLRFRHVRGVTRGMEVTWHIRPEDGGGCHVTIEHEFRRPLPFVAPDLLPRLVDRWFTTAIATRTLRTFRGLAERSAGASGPDTPAS